MCIYRQSRNVHSLVGAAHLDGRCTTAESLDSVAASRQHATPLYSRGPVHGTSSAKSVRSRWLSCQPLATATGVLGLKHSVHLRRYALFLSRINIILWSNLSAHRACGITYCHCRRCSRTYSFLRTGFAVSEPCRRAYRSLNAEKF